MFRKSVVVAVWLTSVLFATKFTLFAQQQTESKGPEKEVEPIRCWFKSDKSAIRVGEKLSVTLTCRVVETDSEKVIPAENTLDPSVISLSPFEVVGGIRHPDIKNGPFRFFQHQYDLRIVGEEFFGKEVPVPELEIKYNIQSKVNGREMFDSREKTYKLPQHKIRIYSLVPSDVQDIRDASRENFGTIRSKTIRSYAAFVAAGLFTLISLTLLLVPFIRSIRQFKRGRSNGTVFSNATLLKKVVRELQKIKKVSMASGWDNELVGRVLTAFRVAGAIALSQQISQLSTRFETKGLEGQLKFRKGLTSRRKVLISSSVTPEVVAKQKHLLDPVWADDFLSVFTVFNDFRYSGKIELADLGAALNKSISLMKRLKFLNNRLIRIVRALRLGPIRGRPVWKQS